MTQHSEIGDVIEFDHKVLDIETRMYLRWQVKINSIFTTADVNWLVCLRWKINIYCLFTMLD